MYFKKSKQTFIKVLFTLVGFLIDRGSCKELARLKNSEAASNVGGGVPQKLYSGRGGVPLVHPETRQVVLPYERARPIRNCTECEKGEGTTACVAAVRCRPLGTKCSDLPEFAKSKVVTATSHYCKNMDGTPGVSLYCCDRGSREALNILTARARPNQYPHQVRVSIDLKRSDAGTITSGSCGGTIINKDWIVTATHCTQPQNAMDKDGKPTIKLTATKLEVLVGQNHIYNGRDNGNVYAVERHVDHKNFSYNPFINDITLLKLSKSLDLSGPYVRALALPEPDFKEKGMVDVLGWGIAETGLLGALLTETVGIVDNPRCEYLTKTKKYDSTMCVGGGEDSIPNRGDSGGPAICRDSKNNPIFCGITSYISTAAICDGEVRPLDLVKGEDLPKGCGYQPAVYTRVSKHLTWISDNMK